MNTFNAISPIDGRYRNKVEALAEFFSERALIRYRIRVEVEDDAHCEPPEGAARNEGDCIEVAVADGNQQRRFCFPRTERIGTVTRYDALVPYDAASGFTAKALEGGVRFNLIVNDSDSDRRESAIGIATEAFLSDSMATVPTVRFEK